MTNYRRAIRYVLLPVAWALLCSSAQAQGIGDWLDKRVEMQATATAGKKKPAQTESIAIDRGSTTFVDQTSAADVISSALNLVPLGGSSADGSGTVNISAYAIYTLVSRQDPLLPDVYNGHQDLRRFSFVIGREAQNDSTGNAQARGTIYGFKILLINTRDASSISSDKKFHDELGAVLRSQAAARGKAAGKLRIFLFEKLNNGRFPDEPAFEEAELKTADKVESAIKNLSHDDQVEVSRIADTYAQAIKTANPMPIVKRLERRPQFSFGFQTIQRPSGSPTEYRGQLIYDQGITDRLFLVLNGTFDYSSTEKLGGDTRGGRGALELKYNITQVAGADLHSPMQLALSGEGERKQNNWLYRAQLKLEIPISTGISLPLSLGYGNRPDLLHQQEKDIFGKFGLTFDIGKIVDGLRQR
ncbi:MAG TPA: hypothetical protein VG759_26880 [Candidatus Angelobacter sp.]|jgi:hypothetical protein|nr:hypothetical protein [Candidatus Angelobacter sp.]